MYILFWTRELSVSLDNDPTCFTVKTEYEPWFQVFRSYCLEQYKPRKLPPNFHVVCFPLAVLRWINKQFFSSDKCVRGKNISSLGQKRKTKLCWAARKSTSPFNSCKDLWAICPPCRAVKKTVAASLNLALHKITVNVWVLFVISGLRVVLPSCSNKRSTAEGCTLHPNRSTAKRRWQWLIRLLFYFRPE